MCRNQSCLYRIIVLKGYDFYRLGENIKALEIYDEALRINPTESGGWYNKGVVFASMSKTDVTYLRALLRVWSRFCQLRSVVQQRNCLTEFGKYIEALRQRMMLF